MKISVIISAVNENLANELLFSIRLNSHIPDDVRLINNTPTGKLNVIVPDLPLTTFIPGNFLGTNEAWRVGLHRIPEDADLVCILNDDLLLNHLFFKKLIQAAETTDASCSVLIPATMDLKSLKQVNLESNNLKVATKCQGWALCIKKSFLDRVPIIPERLKIFFGDDWYFQTSKALGLHWVMMADNPVFHYGGFSTSQRLSETRRIRTIERPVFKEEFQKWLSHQPTVQA